MKNNYRITIFVLVLLASVAHAQTFIKLKVQFPTLQKEPANSYVNMPMMLGLELEKKIGIDKAISIGISNKSINYSTDVNWASQNDFLTYVRDYTKNDFIDGWLADPDINFHYLYVPVGFRLQARLFFGFKYQTGFNFLLNKPEFKEGKYSVPLQNNSQSPIVIDHTLTVFFTAFGFFDMYGSYTLSNPWVKHERYSYDFMKDFAKRQTIASFGMNFSVAKIKKKKI